MGEGERPGSVAHLDVRRVPWDPPVNGIGESRRTAVIAWAMERPPEANVKAGLG